MSLDAIERAGAGAAGRWKLSPDAVRYRFSLGDTHVEAAAALGVGRTTIQRMVRHFGIQSARPIGQRRYPQKYSPPRHPRARPLLDRFEEMYIPEPNSGCWLWTSSLTGKRYGGICVGGRVLKAHRVSWELFRGPIPKGLHICHKCDVTICVNPDHLFPGTQKQNMADCAAKGRMDHAGERNGRARLTIEQVRMIRSSALGARKLAKMLGVGKTAVFQVKQGKTWVGV